MAYGGNPATLRNIGSEFADLSNAYNREIQLIKDTVEQISSERVWVGGEKVATYTTNIKNCYEDFETMRKAILSYSTAMTEAAAQIERDFN